ncbi:efflux RND transporter permease subunit [Stappia sp. F7233]|uniref:Efflux RND transporter permease subunit n=1 Tax=Stappia albiluteola TaxID=2758565 RepID=A0A839AJF6_9HYPH|nr:efflux RND transporter permease subunit [Stappia albiluteola]MBA5779206.1 efflux RND transporter permease subunit [Stappia albiluteola]
MRHAFTPVGLIGQFIRHPNAANLVMALMILCGAFALAKLNTEFFPQIVTDRIRVTVAWPGASSQDVEKNVLQLVEPELRFIDNIDEITSYAREGSASIQLDFVEGADMQKALSDVDQAISAITTLPEDAEVPVVSVSTWFDSVARVALRGPFSEDALKTFARRIRDGMIARGIDKVSFSGFRDTEYLVEIPERDLRRLDLTVGDVAGKIAENTRDLPSGDLKGAVERQIRALSDTTSPQAVAKIEIKSFPTGERVRISDIGTVVQSFEDGQTRGFSDGLRAVELNVQRSAGADTLKTNQILDAYLTEIAPELPASLEVVKYEVRADLLNDRIFLLVKNGLSGLVLVAVILFAFLNSRIALWVVAGIPVAMMATIGFMWVMGETINMISLFALIMTLGIIVDDAIVVGEHTATRYAMGDDPYLAAERGAGRMILPVVAASLTTIASFLPILLVGSAIGQVMGVLPLVVVAVVTASLIECFFVLPGHLAHALERRPAWNWWRVLLLAAAPAFFVIALAARPDIAVPPLLDPIAVPARAFRSDLGALGFDIVLLSMGFAFALMIEACLMLMRRAARRRDEAERPGWFRRTFDAGFDWFRDRPFRAFVRFAFNWRYATLAMVVASLIVAVGMVRGGRVGFVFFPSPEAENIRATVNFNPGIPEEQAIAALREIEGTLRAVEKDLTKDGGEKLVVASFATLGEAGFNRGDHVAGIDVQLAASERRSVRTAEILRAWRANLPRIPGISRIAIYERRGGPPGRDLDIRLQNGTPEDLKAASLELQELLTGYPGVSGVADDLAFGKPELVMELTPRGRALGFTVEGAARQIRNAFEGAIPRKFTRNDEEITIRVRQTVEESGASMLRNLSLRAPNGEFVPFSEIVTLEDRQGFAAIQRRDGKTTVSVTADVDYEVTSNIEILEDLTAGKLQAIAGKYGIDFAFSGREEERQEAFADLKVGTLAALAAIYIILAAIFASYSRPLVVMSIIPFGIVGAIVGHYLLGFQLTVLSLIGLLGLAGILVNDSIILVSRADERLKEGDSIAEAVVGASQDRLRAVLLTSLTTIGGLLPLLFEKSLQAQFLMPMAITIVFGLASATILVLVLVPALMGIGSDIARLIFIDRDDPDEPSSARDITPAE